MSTDLLFQSAFFQPCKSTNGEMAPMDGSNLAVGSDMAPTVASVGPCLSLGLVVEYWPFVATCTHHSYTKL